jgi:hypothetical protein
MGFLIADGSSILRAIVTSLSFLGSVVGEERFGLSQRPVSRNSNGRLSFSLVLVAARLAWKRVLEDVLDFYLEVCEFVCLVSQGTLGAARGVEDSARSETLFELGSDFLPGCVLDGDEAHAAGMGGPLCLHASMKESNTYSLSPARTEYNLRSLWLSHSGEATIVSRTGVSHGVVVGLTNPLYAFSSITSSLASWIELLHGQLDEKLEASPRVALWARC